MTDEDIVGTVVELEVGPVAHGGHCVARHEGQVVFVRHALPGERVHARVTEQTAKYLRADAVEVLTPSADRVEPPCPYAGPGRCGGCDFQHANIVAQRRLKAHGGVGHARGGSAGSSGTVVMESPRATTASAGGPGCGTPCVDGRPGMYAHRSHDLVQIDRCLIAHPVRPDVLGQRWPGTCVGAGGRLVEGKTAVRTDEEPAGGVMEVVRRPAVPGGGRMGSGRCTRRPRRRWWTPCWPGWSLRRGRRRWICTPGVGLFAAFLAEAGCAVLAIEGDKDGGAQRPAEPARPAGVTLETGDVDRVLNAAAGAGARVTWTWSCWTRRGPVRARTSYGGSRR